MKHIGLKCIALMSVIVLGSGCATVCTPSGKTKPMASYAEPVSYTHLTLPTNREV